MEFLHQEKIRVIKEKRAIRSKARILSHWKRLRAALEIEYAHNYKGLSYWRLRLLKESLKTFKLAVERSEYLKVLKFKAYQHLKNVAGRRIFSRLRENLEHI
jgi:hypothetical protein